MAGARVAALYRLTSAAKSYIRPGLGWQVGRHLSDEVSRAQAAGVKVGQGGPAGKDKKLEPTVFDHILAGTIPADIVYEDEHCLAFRDVAPQAPTHILLIPRTRIPTLADATQGHATLLGHLLMTAKVIAAKEDLQNGFRIVINNGVEGCQSVYHLHLHILGGRQMTWPPG